MSALDDDFFSQVIHQLEADSALLAAIGQTDTTPKIFGDVAEGSPQLPYLVLTEVNETPNYQGPDGGGIAWHFDRGVIVVHVFAAGKTQARQIGVMVQQQLDDAPIAPNDGILLEIRQSGASFVPVGETGPQVSTVACRQLQFTYMIQRQS